MNRTDLSFNLPGVGASSPGVGPSRILNACTGVNTEPAHSRLSERVEAGVVGPLAPVAEKSTGAIRAARERVAEKSAAARLAALLRHGADIAARSVDATEQPDLAAGLLASARRVEAAEILVADIQAAADRLSALPSLEGPLAQVRARVAHMTTQAGHAPAAKEPPMSEKTPASSGKTCTAPNDQPGEASAPALGWRREGMAPGSAHVPLPMTAAEQALVAELATLRAADAEVRALVQAKDGQDTADAVVRHLAKLDHHVEVARASARKTAAELVEARRGCERLRREAVAATATRNEAQRGGATGKTDAPPTERVVAELVYASPDYMDKVFARARSVDGLETSLGARDIAEGVAADEFRRVMRLPPRHTVKLTDITDALAAKVGHLDDIARAFGTPDLNHLLLAAEARSLVRQVAALEKVAQRQPVAPGPRLLHPQEHPAVTAATVAAVGKLCCDANAAAIDDLRDGLAIDDGADMAEVVSVVLASRKADHAAIAELRAELADTRRLLTIATCDARDLRAKASRTIGQRVARAISRALKGGAL